MSNVLHDPEMQALAAALSGEGAPRITSASPVQIRELMAAMRPPVTVELHKVVDSSISAGDLQISTREYIPSPEPGITLLYFHGGGWCLGSIDDYDHYLRKFAHLTGASIISVEYRLAPEHRYPAAVDDAWMAYQAVADARTSLVIAGDSAGANLAAVVAQRAVALNDRRLKGQVLLYPMVDGNLQRQSLFEFEPPVLTRDEIVAFVDNYIPQSARADVSFSPIDGSSFERLPPALVVTAEADLLAEQAEAYADKIESAGVYVARHKQSSAIHGYLSLAPDSQATAESLVVVSQFLDQLSAQ